MAQRQEILQKIGQLGNYTTDLSNNIRASAQGNRANSVEILRVLDIVAEAVRALIAVKRGQETTLVEARRQLAETQAQLARAQADLDSGLAKARTDSQAALAAAEEQKAAAIAQAQRANQEALAAANAEHQAAIQRLTSRQQEDNASFASQMADKQRQLDELAQRGEASSAQAERLSADIARMTSEHEQEQARLRAQLGREKADFEREKEGLAGKYQEDLAAAQERARGEQAAAVAQQSETCARALADYEREIQAALDAALINQDAFLTELSEIVPLEQLNVILERLSALNQEIGGANPGGPGGPGGDGSGRGQGGARVAAEAARAQGERFEVPPGAIEYRKKEIGPVSAQRRSQRPLPRYQGPLPGPGVFGSGLSQNQGRQGGRKLKRTRKSKRSKGRRTRRRQ